MKHHSTYTNLAAYAFTDLPEPAAQLKQAWLPKLRQWQLKGTILLSDNEGINVNLAGSREGIEAFVAMCVTYPEFADLPFKYSESTFIPFSKTLIKLKQQIIPTNTLVDPKARRARRIDAKTLKAWLDENKDFVLLDTRNTYEIKHGKFSKAIDCHIDNFRDLEDMTAVMSDKLKAKPVVSYCTGGIRCEKVALSLEAQGFKEVYQLEGGILKYFEEVGGTHYDGVCYVFDDRVAVNPDLSEVRQPVAAE